MNMSEFTQPEPVSESLYTILQNDQTFWPRFSKFIDRVNLERKGETNEKDKWDYFLVALKTIKKELSDSKSLFPALLKLTHSRASEESKGKLALELAKAARIPIIMVEGYFGFTNNGTGMLPYGRDEGESRNCGTVVPWIKASNYVEISKTIFQNQQQIISNPNIQTELSWVMVLSSAAKENIAEVAHEAMAYKLVNSMTNDSTPKNREALLAIKNEHAIFQLSTTLVLWDLLIHNEQAFRAMQHLVA